MFLSFQVEHAHFRIYTMGKYYMCSHLCVCEGVPLRPTKAHVTVIMTLCFLSQSSEWVPDLKGQGPQWHNVLDSIFPKETVDRSVRPMGLYHMFRLKMSFLTTPKPSAIEHQSPKFRACL